MMAKTMGAKMRPMPANFVAACAACGFVWASSAILLAMAACEYGSVKYATIMISTATTMKGARKLASLGDPAEYRARLVQYTEHIQERAHRGSRR